MKTGLLKFLKRSFRRSQSGQSLVILAFGFVGLLSFVGIVTDVSLMFVRYTSLTRAVDAASIAAAGQVRRQVPFASEIAEHCSGVDENGRAWSPNNPCDDAENAAFARSFGNVGVAARQFIEFYGLDPQAVLIDMCFTVSKVDPTTRDLVPLYPELQDKFDELCVGAQGRNADRKLIKVTAQIDSPTVFLRLLGFGNIPLEASSISETAVLDVVLIMDVSESMLNQTTYDTWAREGYTEIFVPPDVYYYNYYFNNQGTTGVGFGQERDHNFGDLGYGFGDYSDDPNNAWWKFRYNLAVQPPGAVFDLLRRSSYLSPSSGGYIANSPFRVRKYQHPDFGAPTKTVREECRVAYWPYAINRQVPQDLKTLYHRVGATWSMPDGNWDGFVPAYDFYRCCNDPDGDGNFSDLLCEPFRQARNATEQFLRRIDFLRGDRVAFVTFDKQAFLVRVEVNPDDHVWSHMIDNESLAINTLRNYIGVRAEPSFYEPTELTDGTMAVPWERTVDNPQARSSELGDHDYEVIANCPFQDAALGYPFSPSTSPPPGETGYDPRYYPNRLTPDSFVGLSVGQRMYPRNEGGYNWQGQTGYGATRSYDLWASCRGTNIGAALREGGNALLDPRTTRTNGSVWVMVLLGDGAAGASDPVFDSDNGLITEPDDLYYPYNSDSFQVKYGGLGLCPTGRTVNDAELTEFGENPYSFPFCSDEVPESRHFCFNPNKQEMINGSMLNLFVDLGDCQGANARYYYDVDDYARDWADWIGLAEPPGLTGGTQRSMTQLPTIFTIGFGLNFNNNTERCKATMMHSGDVPDCLGEELLRYIADVGDNFRIDSDYQQRMLAQMAGTTLTNDDYGPRSECEDELVGVAPADADFNTLVQPQTAKTSCGNYYNAPAPDELGRVFDDIASRMFTRLTQ